MTNNIHNRILRLYDQIKQCNAEAVILSNPKNMFYFSGFTGEGFVVIADNQWTIITDGRYAEQAEKETLGFDVLVYGAGTYEQIIKKAISGYKKLAIESDDMTVASRERLASICPDTVYIATIEIGKQIRKVKDNDELQTMRQAAGITEEGFNLAIELSQPGVKESELLAELQYFMVKRYNAKPAFDFVVASGENGSLPHAIPGDRRFASGDFITLDFGAKVGGYCSDMTRTYGIGRIDIELLKIYDIVEEAHQRAYDSLRPGTPCAEIDAIARDYIASQGYGEYFGHGLGHGVGLDIHELPVLNQTSMDVLQKNMVVTVEPGIYLPGKGGVRIENTCVITEDGAETLFTSTKELIIL